MKKAFTPRRLPMGRPAVNGPNPFRLMGHSYRVRMKAKAAGVDPNDYEAVSVWFRSTLKPRGEA